MSFFIQLRVSYLFSLELGNLIGIIFLILALLINILVSKAFQTNATPDEPFSRPRALIQKGIFSLSRNPVYIALIILQIALGFILDNAYLFLSAVLLFLLLDSFVIKDEEQMLLEVFGKEYENYSQHAPRWFFSLSSKKEYE